MTESAIGEHVARWFVVHGREAYCICCNRAMDDEVAAVSVPVWWGMITVFACTSHSKAEVLSYLEPELHGIRFIDDESARH